MGSTLSREEQEARSFRKLAVISFERAFAFALEGECKWAVQEAELGRACTRQARRWELAAQGGEGR